MQEINALKDTLFITFSVSVFHRAIKFTVCLFHLLNLDLVILEVAGLSFLLFLQQENFLQFQA